MSAWVGKRALPSKSNFCKRCCSISSVTGEADSAAMASKPKLWWYLRDWTVPGGKVTAEFHFTKGGCDIKNHFKISRDILCFNGVHNYFWILWYKGFLLKSLDFSRDFRTGTLQLSLPPSNQQFGSMCAWTWDHLRLEEIKSKISSLQRDRSSSIWRNVFWGTLVLHQDRANKSHIPRAPQMKKTQIIQLCGSRS